MKKLLLIIALFFINKANAQFQPMAVLPEVMRSTSFNSLCLDLFEDAPTSEALYDVPGGTIRGVGERGDYRKLDIHNAKGALSKDGASFIIPHANGSGATGTVDDRLKDFATQKISEYNKPGFKTSTAMHRQLQDEVWAYNVLNKKGYLSGSGDVLEDYNKAVKDFKRDYGIRQPGVSRITEIGDIEHAYHKANIEFNIEGSSLIITGPESSYHYKIKHDLNFPNEERIITNNEPAIKAAVEVQVVKTGPTMRLEVKPFNNHNNHSLIIHVRNHADVSIPLSDNSHAVIFTLSKVEAIT